jgi:hypothetical protein
MEVKYQIFFFVYRYIDRSAKSKKKERAAAARDGIRSARELMLNREGVSIAGLTSEERTRICIVRSCNREVRRTLFPLSLPPSLSLSLFPLSTYPLTPSLSLSPALYSVGRQLCAFGLFVVIQSGF